MLFIICAITGSHNDPDMLRKKQNNAPESAAHTAYIQNLNPGICNIPKARLDTIMPKCVKSSPLKNISSENPDIIERITTSLSFKLLKAGERTSSKSSTIAWNFFAFFIHL